MKQIFNNYSGGFPGKCKEVANWLPKNFASHILFDQLHQDQLPIQKRGPIRHSIVSFTPDAIHRRKKQKNKISPSTRMFAV